MWRVFLSSTQDLGSTKSKPTEYAVKTGRLSIGFASARGKARETKALDRESFLREARGKLRCPWVLMDTHGFGCHDKCSPAFAQYCVGSRGFSCFFLVLIGSRGALNVLMDLVG